MAYNTKMKPGYMFRACTVWVILNIILLATMGALIWMLGNYARAILTEWYVVGILMVGVIVSEWVILGETIAPIMKAWIKQEEESDKDGTFSWNRKAPAGDAGG